MAVACRWLDCGDYGESCFTLCCAALTTMRYTLQLDGPRTLLEPATCPTQHLGGAWRREAAESTRAKAWRKISRSATTLRALSVGAAEAMAAVTGGDYHCWFLHERQALWRCRADRMRQSAWDSMGRHVSDSRMAEPLPLCLKITCVDRSPGPRWHATHSEGTPRWAWRHAWRPPPRAAVSG